ncbi:hypothetical protein [Pseudobacteriovorax antillogorgiicola]|uniref:Outer membrane protein beta-barrel domain-containing protein n=1 Tax=Pseudobacteriovorax antillogorgiicola TaxID=1513793 RepID=A0A1Y6CMG1_9BACT|nr:hypothetical protein [Pseudobacteriovorax antillogorgiicola]TCS45031.1 hypothetical protein EDD56_13068 [Pseudobacteriovorax antillogorgiicola]SMF76188.1 hypothetical protein SAMN06296036_1306 [Pseudobacteriovorax antillogorgiicola]
MISRLLLVIAFAWSSSSFAQEGFMLDFNAFYFQKKEERSNTAGTETIDYETEYLFLGLGICYRTGPWCFGGKYLRGEIGNINNNGILDGNIELEGFGASLGYVADGFVGQATYLFEAEKRFGDSGIGGNTNTEYPAKEALMVDLGYGFNIGSTFFGPNLKWFQFKYDKRTVNGQSESLARTEKDEYLLPMFSIWTFF